MFTAGEVQTTKGAVLFDARAAETVMAAYAEHGDEVMIDLEHLSLENVGESRNFDPDARGWCRLELRCGELWAVAVRWTPDGELRLRERRQRFISPAFDIDQSRRVTRLVNIALTALPATHGLTPLIAANNRTLKMADGIDLQSLAEYFKVTEDPAANPAAFVAALAAKLDEARTKLFGDAAPPSADPMAAEAMTTRAEVIRLTGAKTALEAVERVSSWRDLALAQERAVAKLAEERAALEATERRAIYAEFVKLGAETPATSGLAINQPAEHLEKMPIEQLRSRRDAFKARSGTDEKRAPRPATTNGGADQLSQRERDLCARKKIDPAVYAAKRDAIRSRSNSPSNTSEG